ncbi:thioredoxin domain-containing protein 15 [Copidosoma floridanum]|uniref:thioredoxin domain-containing protein 15 n=1 Tax=Copidosoma floridanum TaxID=29053 RepID=UPI0006C9B932|nr:thioredoxin domain-containing protein 15 [Copidosoma floridanum]
MKNYMKNIILLLFTILVVQVTTIACNDGEEILNPTEMIKVSKESSSMEKSNVTITDPNTINFTKVNCLTDKTYGPVEIVNHTRLMELLILEKGAPNRTRSSKEDKALPGVCIFIMFYARWCVFSSQAAPHFNAIPRFYPHIKVAAIDAMKYQNFNTQYGIVGVPTLMLVHNTKPVAKFNETVYTLETFSKFISHLTNLQPNESLFVTSADFSGPVSSVPSNETDYCLVLSWIFISACLLYFTTKSQWWRQFIELVQNTWRESNAQHEHAD